MGNGLLQFIANHPGKTKKLNSVTGLITEEYDEIIKKYAETLFYGTSKHEDVQDSPLVHLPKVKEMFLIMFANIADGKPPIDESKTPKFDDVTTMIQSTHKPGFEYMLPIGAAMCNMMQKLASSTRRRASAQKSVEACGRAILQCWLETNDVKENGKETSSVSRRYCLKCICR